MESRDSAATRSRSASWTLASGWAQGGHDDLYFKEGCLRNFTNDGLSAFNDQVGHGTHVLGIIAGTGSANSRYRGMAPSVGLLGGGGIRAAKVFRKDDNDPDGVRGDTQWVRWTPWTGWPSRRTSVASRCR